MKKLNPRDRSKVKLVALVCLAKSDFELKAELKRRLEERVAALALTREERAHYYQIETGVGRLYERLRKRDYQPNPDDLYLLHFAG